MHWPKQPPPFSPFATNCSIEGQTCIIGQDNLLASYAGVESLPQCEALCIDNYDCEFISYFGPDSFPLRNYCMLFSECDILTECQDCTTAEEICFEQCGHKVEGPLEENVLEIIPGVQDELTCKAACRNESDCEAYTYHDNSDLLLPGICFMLTEVQAPLQSCQHCSTGFPNCRNITAVRCIFTIGEDTTPLTSYKFTETNITTVNILAVGNCELTVVAIGGGGKRGAGDGGGGSGYVASTNLTVSTSQLVVTVGVGGPGELSSLETSEGETIIAAQPGGSGNGDGNSGDGGAGYSGGGGGCYYDGGNGGEDGGDGHNNRCGNGGAGSGLQISSIPISSFTLTPGRGGKSKSGGYYGGGGGGGGVLVDGSGPQESEYDGEGYGGGAFGGGTSGVPGPGLVLLEMRPEQ